MSYKTDYYEDKIIATFTGNIEKNEIRYSFLEILENVSIKKIKHLIYDYSGVENYEVPDDILDTVKNYTKFSETWNNKVNIIAVGTHQNVQKAANIIIENRKNLDLIWDYLLFEDMETAMEWCEKN